MEQTRGTTAEAWGTHLPSSPPGKSRWAGRLTLLLITALVIPAAEAQSSSPIDSLIRSTANLIPGFRQDSEPQAKDDRKAEPEKAAAERANGDTFGAEYLVALRAATAVWTGPVEQALSFLGTPYRMGGVSRSGIDCSGLVGLIFSSEGFTLPRTAAEQFRIGTPIELEGLRAGDLVFFENTYRRGISHVGIYIGDGKFVHAENRRRGVVVSRLDEAYYQARFVGGRRLLRMPGDDLAAVATRRANADADATEVGEAAGGGGR